MDRVLWLIITVIEIVLAGAYCLAVYHAFSDPSGGVAQGILALLLGWFIFSTIFLIMRLLWEDAH